MISEKQLEANRRNARLSTGPKTEAGKARSSQNAKRDSLTGQVEIMTEDDRIAFDAFSLRLTKTYDPQGDAEQHYASLVVEAMWRLHRISAVENNTFALGHNSNSNVVESGHAEINAAFAAAITWQLNSKELDRLSLYEQRLTRTMQKNRAMLQTLQATRKVLEAQAMAEAELLLQLSEINGLAYKPAADGFVFTISQITASLNRKNRLKEAYAAINGPIPSLNPGGNGKKSLIRVLAA
jgi:hypothetical protein